MALKIFRLLPGFQNFVQTTGYAIVMSQNISGPVSASTAWIKWQQLFLSEIAFSCNYFSWMFTSDHTWIWEVVIHNIKAITAFSCIDIQRKSCSPVQTREQDSWCAVNSPRHLLKMDTSLRWTVGAGPEHVHLRGSWLYNESGLIHRLMPHTDNLNFAGTKLCKAFTKQANGPQKFNFSWT